MEFFIFGVSTKNGGPKHISKILADITGYAPLPPYYSLGFHYSKWETISTERLLHLNTEFDNNMLPVDLFWIDIDYTVDNKYFEFDENKF
jgi:alpha 1,3-glucosidase